MARARSWKSQWARTRIPQRAPSTPWQQHPTSSQVAVPRASSACGTRDQASASPSLSDTPTTYATSFSRTTAIPS
ncbi:hypothetical protein IG631_16065 [Alternaria alternata]|nr:hypothetical protein IG631_16065 [Alternaria alternata]